MALERWLLDTSAFFNLSASPDSELWGERIQRGLVGISTTTLLEIGYSTRSPNDYVTIFGSPVMRNLVTFFSSAHNEKRVIEVQRSLISAGSHRAPSIPDLLVAAIAESNNLTVLHVDKDFEIIAGVTGQPVEKLSVRPRETGN
jgi:predicted nucleic acid-binding protein